MGGRTAGDDEVAAWQQGGWVLLEGLIDADEIDAAADELAEVFPSPKEYHADPAGTRARWLGQPPPSHELWVWPPDGPGFRPEQHRWHALFPLPGQRLNRLFVHPSIVDFAERALATTDIRCYQAQVSAKYAGETNFEQPMHTDRNHSWLPAVPRPPWWHLETFLYLSDVGEGNAPTHLVPIDVTADRSTTVPLIMPDRHPEIYAAELGAPGRRGSLLAYRTDVFHRAVDLTDPTAHRYLLNVSYKVAGQDWINYHVQQSNSTSLEWVGFVEGCTPRELELFGFPPPGHPIWDLDLVKETARLYPKLDLEPWLTALA
ncbi:MAG TPA: hypothetical protein VKG43_03805 [Acidimicrobiales bacterium]|nr:hypothetical protein [Acidimicrobiales bacterium]